MSIFKLKEQVNWKYILREIMLLFVGISLAIAFNNWNANMKTNRQVKIAIKHIKEEVQSNITELSSARLINETILNAYNDYQKLYDGNTSDLIATPQQLKTLRDLYPGFFSVADSTRLHAGIFRYTGTTYIDLQLPELSEIAWETTKSISLTAEFKYECLYDLESMYNLQRHVQIEIKKAANALQKREIEELMNILDFIKQLDLQLEKDYQNMLREIDNCI